MHVEHQHIYIYGVIYYMIIWDICQGEHHSTKVFLASLCWYGLQSQLRTCQDLSHSEVCCWVSSLNCGHWFMPRSGFCDSEWASGNLGSQFQSRHLHGTLCSIRLVNCSEDPAVADAIPDSSQSRSASATRELGNCIGEAYYHGVNPNGVQNMTKLNVRLPKRHAMFFVRG